MKYSIITPVYNREDCVERCLDSVIRNLRDDLQIEHIVVDDGSQDNSVELIKKYANNYTHIRYIFLPNNKGTNAARNAGIAIADGDYCIILDSDDYLVNDAISFIDHIVKVGKYKAYMFAANDMVDYYRFNPVLRGRSSVVLNYRDFLRGDIGGDFIHCISTKILKNNPFDDHIRTFEAVFFLRFFREAQEMLFTNRVVTIRERSRSDSITRTMILSNKNVISKYYYVNSLRYDWFKEDYIKYKEFESLTVLLNNLLYYSLLLSNRGKAERWYKEIQSMHLDISRKNHILYYYRLGRIFSFLIKVYFILKYDVLCRKLS